MAFEKKIALAGSHRDAVKGASQTRPVGEHELVSATVVLRRRTSPETPESFAFSTTHRVKHPTREEFGVLHGASSSDIRAIEAFAHEYGLTVTESSQARRSVVLSGTAGNMQRAFGVTLNHYTSPRGTYRGRTGPVMIPEELQGIVTAVLGLDNRPIAKPHVRFHAAQPDGSVTPVQVGKLYGFPSGNGTGQTIGIIELGGGYKTADLTTYFKGLGLKSPAVKSVSVDGGVNHPGADTDADGEVMLDIEVAGSVAPGASIVVYFAPNTDQGFVDAISKAVHDATNKPSVISISWGGPESSWTAQSMTALDEALQAAAAMGVTVCVASGDDGSSDGVGDGADHADFPASSPHSLACGGTN